MPVTASHLEFPEASIPTQVRRLLFGPRVGRSYQLAGLV